MNENRNSKKLFGESLFGFVGKDLFFLDFGESEKTALAFA